MEKVGAPLSRKVVLIGGSAGALEVLFALLPLLKTPAFPIVIVLHRKGSDGGGLESLLASKTEFRVKEVEDKDTLRAGSIFLAPGDYHLLFEQDGTLSLDDSEKVAFSRPSIDVSFQSAAEVYGDGVTGILLSGANADGSEGLKCIRQLGGTTIAQSPETTDMPFMPQHAIEEGVVDFVYNVEAIAANLNR